MANKPRVTPDDPQLTALIDGERMRMLFAPIGQMVIMGGIQLATQRVCERLNMPG